MGTWERWGCPGRAQLPGIHQPGLLVTPDLSPTHCCRPAPGKQRVPRAHRQVHTALLRAWTGQVAPSLPGNLFLACQVLTVAVGRGHQQPGWSGVALLLSLPGPWGLSAGWVCWEPGVRKEPALASAGRGEGRWALSSLKEILLHGGGKSAAWGTRGRCGEEDGGLGRRWWRPQAGGGRSPGKVAARGPELRGVSHGSWVGP